MKHGRGSQAPAGTRGRRSRTWGRGRAGSPVSPARGGTPETPRGAGPTPRAAPGGAFCSGRGAAGSQSGGTLAVLRPSLRKGTDLRPRGRGRGPPVSGVPLSAGPSRGAGVSLARLQLSRQAEAVAPARHRCPAMGRRWPALPHKPTAGFRQSPAGQGQRLHPQKTTSVLSSHQKHPCLCRERLILPRMFGNESASP